MHATKWIHGLNRQMMPEDECVMHDATFSRSTNLMRHSPAFQVNDRNDDAGHVYEKTYFCTSDRLRRGEALLIDTGAWSNLSGSEWVEGMNQMNCKSGMAPPSYHA